MNKRTAALLFALATAAIPMLGKTVVFWQEGFPVVASQPVSLETLQKVLETDTSFLGLEALKKPDALKDTDLLVLPYGSAFPAEAWSSIQAHLRAGGNLLLLGGQALRVPIAQLNGKFVQGTPQTAYSKEFDISNSYALPAQDKTRFSWRPGYDFMPSVEIRAKQYFVLEDQVKYGLTGLGYMVNEEGLQVSAPVVMQQHASAGNYRDAMLGSRVVMLCFEPEKGYWDSADGRSLIKQTADYARQGAVSFWVELYFSTVKPGEAPDITLHYYNARHERFEQIQAGQAKVELLSGDTILETVTIPCPGGKVDSRLPFQKPLEPGFYKVRAYYSEGGNTHEYYQNGFWVEDKKLLTTGPRLGVKGDFLTQDGKPYFPVGTNHFNTENSNWDFSGPRNALSWDRDFSEMAKCGITFVRTGVWTPNSRFFDEMASAVSERFLRNVEAYFLCARRHNINVNFTFFSFFPRSGEMRWGVNPYLDPGAIRGQKDYLISVVNRFKDVPWVSWDLINEPSYCNPGRPWHGNTPNNDGVEQGLWHQWLKRNYGTLPALAEAWQTTPDQLGSFDNVPLPGNEDLDPSRSGNTRQVRAFDYNLFANEMFPTWIKAMISAIRSTGSTQLVNVGNDEGGVADRMLNHFYASSGVAYTTNHSYWRDDALLWDSIAAKVPGVPAIIGETNYQPAWAPDGAWRWDEFTGFPLNERKFAFGFAGGLSGVLHWSWDQEADFGVKRSDGSMKTWNKMLREMGRFAAEAAPHATELVLPQIAIVLPQSLQLSVWNSKAQEIQQRCLRVLYNEVRADAYMVGEYQIEKLGNPKLILLPSPFLLSKPAWDALRAKAEAGATVLITGPFDLDPHFRPTGRQAEVGLDYRTDILTIREQILKLPKGEVHVSFGGDRTTNLYQGFTPDGTTWIEKPLGKGRLLFSVFPLELNDNAQVLADVYTYAIKVAGVQPTFTTTLKDTGILICPTRFPKATLYVLVSESQRKQVSFKDAKSKKTITGELEPGRAAMLVLGEDGAIKASYNWK